MSIKHLYCAAFLLGGLTAQTTVNPDVTAIGDLLYGPDTGWTTSGVELALQGYVNPYAYATAILHKPDGETPVDLEEGFLSIDRGLPLGLGLKLGRFRPDVGHVNREHEHTYAYIDPLESAVTFLGEEMWSGNGLAVNALLPLPWYSQLEMNVLSALPETPDSLFAPGGALAWSWRQFWDLGLYSHLEWGLGDIAPSGSASNSVWNTYLKFKWKPDSYRAAILQAEGFALTGRKNRPAGGYVWGDLRIRKVWSVGFVVDGVWQEKDLHVRAGVMAGFSPVEETTVFRWILLQDSTHQWSWKTQVVWSLGPHKPHQF
ncbi:MAG: hypothetical protein D6762_02490 [Candidatus Neomarinimicrobiota bacterium]|nr:MAG: hypothetical protein D6762_02490 [Candidatus Neomarinimicrobiota bacterium]